MITMADVSAAPLSKAEVDRIIEGNLTDEFWKLKSTPGYRVTRCSWQQVSLTEFALSDWRSASPIKQASEGHKAPLPIAGAGTLCRWQRGGPWQPRTCTS